MSGVDQYDFYESVQIAINAAPPFPKDTAGSLEVSAMLASRPPHAIYAPDLGGLRELVKTYILNAPKFNSSGIETMLNEVDHEGQHGRAALKMGARSVGFWLTLYNRGRSFQLITTPLGLSHEGNLVVCARPVKLSPGDQLDLKREGMTVRDADQIAVENDWPRPLSLRRWWRRYDDLVVPSK